MQLGNETVLCSKYQTSERVMCVPGHNLVRQSVVDHLRLLPSHGQIHTDLFATFPGPHGRGNEADGPDYALPCREM